MALEKAGSVMKVIVSETADELGQVAASRAAGILRERISNAGRANVILATGASQFATLQHLVEAPEIDWSHVHCFHLDEYLGVPADHPASFRRYLRERFVEKLPVPPASFHYISGEGDPVAECERLGALISDTEIDVALIGIGENGHLAFNDPPADFETESPYLVVDLDLACRQQQLGEGWFPSLESVPTQAISMSIRQILASDWIICSVPDLRKAAAVQQAVEGPLTQHCPASALQQHSQTELYLDRPSASKLTRS